MSKKGSHLIMRSNTKEASEVKDGRSVFLNTVTGKIYKVVTKEGRNYVNGKEIFEKYEDKGIVVSVSSRGLSNIDWSDEIIWLDCVDLVANKTEFMEVMFDSRGVCKIIVVNNNVEIIFPNEKRVVYILPYTFLIATPVDTFSLHLDVVDGQPCLLFPRIENLFVKIRGI